VVQAKAAVAVKEKARVRGRKKGRRKDREQA